MRSSSTRHSRPLLRAPEGKEVIGAVPFRRTTIPEEAYSQPAFHMWYSGGTQAVSGDVALVQAAQPGLDGFDEAGAVRGGNAHGRLLRDPPRGSGLVLAAAHRQIPPGAGPIAARPYP